MKVSETLNISRKQNGYESVRKLSDDKRAKEVIGTSTNVRNGSSVGHKTSHLKEERVLPEPRAESRGRTSSPRRQGRFETEGNNSHGHDASPTRRRRGRQDYDKPWLPTSRKSSTTKSSTEAIDSDNVSKTSENASKKPAKTPTPPSQISPEKEKVEKAKISLENSELKALKKNGHNNGRNESLHETSFSKGSLPSSNSIEKRSKVQLKRQFALDQPPVTVAPSNLKESLSEESLNSINSVTQLLKIERGSFALNNKKTKHNDDEDDEEEIITGVKQMAAKLEAKNAKRRSSNEIKGRNNENSSKSGNSCIIDNASNYKTRSTIFSSKESDKANSVGKTTFQEAKEVKGTTAKQPTKAGIIISESSSVLLKAAAAVVCSLQTERKKVNSSKIASSSSLTSPTATSKSHPKPTTENTFGVANSQEGKKESLSSPSKTSIPIERQRSVNKSNSVDLRIDPNNRSRSRSRTRSSSPLKPQSIEPRKADPKPDRAGLGASSPERKCSFSVDPPEKKVVAKEYTSATRKSRSPTRKGSISAKGELRRKSFAEQEIKARSPSGSRKGSLSSGGGVYSATASSLAKQKPNRIKDQREESINGNKERVSKANNKSQLINSITSNQTNTTGISTTDFRGQGQRKNAVERSRISEKFSNKRGNADTNVGSNESPRRSGGGNNTVPLRDVSPIRSKTNTSANATKPSTVKGNGCKAIKQTSKNFVTDSKIKEVKSSTVSDWKFGICTESKKIKSDVRNNNNIKSFKESANLSSSSSASSSSSSLPSLRRSKQSNLRSGTYHRKEKSNIVIPTIIMSEYVDGEKGEKAVVVNKEESHSVFTPLEFIEPLEPTCDIEEGSSLELKVRVKGAETVVWVKGNKIIPNAPPDFQYFQEKSKNLYGLRIADAFLEDAGLYICEAYGAEGKEITSWCEVNVIEAITNEDDGDISWDDLDLDIMSEEVKSPQPLVVPVIVTSQAEQDYETDDANAQYQSAEPCPMRSLEVQVKQIDTDIKSCEQNAETNKKNEENLATTSNPSRINKSSFSSHKEALRNVDKSFSMTKSNSAKDTCFSNQEEISEKRSSRDSQTITNSFSTERKDSQSTCHSEEKRKLMSQLSSASDESIYLKETRSGDEGALSCTEDTSATISCLDVKSNATNDDEITTESPDPTISSSPCSEQNGRSSSVDSAIGLLGRPLFSDGKFPPRILVGPSNIIALYGEVVHLRVKVQNYGIPKTSVNWFKFINGTYKKIEHSAVGIDAFLSSQPNESQPHISVTRCGTALNTLTITHVNYDDCGRYRVKVQNVLGMDSHDCLLTVEGPPEPPSSPPKVRYDGKSKTILIHWSSCPYDGGSKITGYYVEASIVQGSKTAINKEDQDNWQLLTPQSFSWLCYTLTEPKRGCVYRFRVFSENNYGKGKPTEPSIPLLVPVLMEGRRAGSSDALLWSLKSLSQEETRAESNRKNIVHEHENETTNLEESASSQEEEPVEYKSVNMKRGTFHDIYEKLDELGKGRFGVVFEVVNKETKKSYAGKFVKCIKAKDKERVQLEVNIMNDLEYHPKLICLIDAFEMPREIIIVTQRIDGGELFERVVADDFTLTEGDCIQFLRQICDAVKYIHSKSIMHLDLKPENILCTSKSSNHIKIIDFGLAQYYDPKKPIRVLLGTAEFVSPEIINYEPIAPSTDNWSVGVITYILLSGLSPFMGDNDNETFSNITTAEFDFDDEAFDKISDDAKDFISNLIVKRPEKRMTAEECLNHHWLKRESDKIKTDVILSTDKLKRFLVRRKWQKTGNAIRALGRITTLYSSRRSSSASQSSTPPGSLSMSVSSPTSPFSPSRSGSLHTQDSLDNDNVFFAHSPESSMSGRSPRNNNVANLSNINNNITPRLSKLAQPSVGKEQLPKTESTTSPSSIRPKYSDPRRTDSGGIPVFFKKPRSIAENF